MFGFPFGRLFGSGVGNDDDVDDDDEDDFLDDDDLSFDPDCNCTECQAARQAYEKARASDREMKF